MGRTIRTDVQSFEDEDFEAFIEEFDEDFVDDTLIDEDLSPDEVMEDQWLDGSYELA